MTLLGKLGDIRWVLDENPNLASSPFGIFDGRCIVDRKLEGNKEEKKWKLVPGCLISEYYILLFRDNLPLSPQEAPSYRPPTSCVCLSLDIQRGLKKKGGWFWF
jgi:hypothetical protein